MNITLFKRELKSNFKIIIIFIAVLSMYSGMIISMFDPDLGKSLNAMAASMPEIFAAFGMAGTGATLIEFVVNYLYGFLLVVFPSVFIILIANRLMSRYIDGGSMAFLLATPNKRSKIAVTQAVFLIFGIFILVAYVTLFSILAGQGMFPGELDISKFLLVNAGLFGLLIFLSGICFFSSSVFNDSKYSYGVGAGCIIAFILIQMVSQVGDKFEALKYATPLTLFDSKGLMAGDGTAVFLMVLLYILGIVFYAAGILIFDKRDLSL